MVIIAISGLIGSGKSVLAKALAERFGLRLVSVGSLFRELAKEMNMDLKSFHNLAEKDHKFDRMVDQKAIEEAKKGNVVIEGHLSCWILKDIADLKIFLHAPLQVRARRIAERDSISIEKALEEIKIREESNKKRYKEIYGIDISDISFMDVVLNSSKISKEALFETLIFIIEAYLSYRDASSNNR